MSDTAEQARDRVKNLLYGEEMQDHYRQIESTLYRVMRLPFWLWWRGPQMISEVLGTGPYWSRGHQDDKSPKTAFGYYWFYLTHPSYWYIYRHWRGYE